MAENGSTPEHPPMKVFYVRAEPVEPPGQPASALVVAEDEAEALTLLRRDQNFTGYALPPAELSLRAGGDAESRALMGNAHVREKGVYDFKLLGSGPPQHA